MDNEIYSRRQLAVLQQKEKNSFAPEMYDFEIRIRMPDVCDEETSSFYIYVCELLSTPNAIITQITTQSKVSSHEITKMQIKF